MHGVAKIANTVEFDGEHRLEEAACALTHDFDGDGFAVREVLVERADRDTGPLGDPGRGEIGPAALPQNANRRLDDRLDRPRRAILGRLFARLWRSGTSGSPCEWTVGTAVPIFDLPASKSKVGAKAMSSLHLVTGATSGLGLELASRLLADRDCRLIVGARRPDDARALRGLAGEDRLTILPLDLASFASTSAFAKSVIDRLEGGTLASFAANAGLQIVGARRLTADGNDETFQANWLGHALLIEWLLPHLAPGAPVVLTASGTHDPEHPGVRRFGFRGGLFPGADRVARGELDASASVKQQGLDRYATSKLCAILYVYALARRVGAAGPRFIAFDPGLMPGTGLARDRGGFEQWAWSNLMPLLAGLMPGASTVARSATSYAKLLTGRAFAHGTGLHVDFNLAEPPSSRDSHRVDWQDELDRLARRTAHAVMN